MEKAPHGDKSAELEKYASDFYATVDFLFARRGVPSQTGDDIMNRYSELHLSPAEIAFVQPVFTEHFIDEPTQIDIMLVGANPATHPDAESSGVQVVTEHRDETAIFITLYTVWFTGRGSDYVEVTKNTRRMPRFIASEEQASLFTQGDLEETIFNDVPLDRYEQAALSAMLAKL